MSFSFPGCFNFLCTAVDSGGLDFRRAHGLTQHLLELWILLHA